MHKLIINCYRGVLALTATSLAIGVNPAPARGQVVQLPTYHHFSLSTSAWVPDAGTAALGGTNYGSAASSAGGWGPYGPRASSSSSGGSMLSASAQVIDLQALDEAILAGRSAPASSSKPTTTQIGRSYVGAPGTLRNPIVATSDPGAWQRALSETPISRAADPLNAESTIRYYLDRAEHAENANRIHSARVYYRMAVEAMTPQLIARYQAILARRAAEVPPATAETQPARKNF